MYSCYWSSDTEKSQKKRQQAIIVLVFFSSNIPGFFCILTATEMLFQRFMVYPCLKLSFYLIEQRPCLALLKAVQPCECIDENAQYMLIDRVTVSISCAKASLVKTNPNYGIDDVSIKIANECPRLLPHWDVFHFINKMQ